MTQFKALAEAPEKTESARIKRIAKRLLKEHLPTLRLKDPQGVQRRAAMKFKAALRAELREKLDSLQDKRSIAVDLFYTMPSKATQARRYYWLLDVRYDSKSDTPRELRMLIPAELA